MRLSELLSRAELSPCEVPKFYDTEITEIVIDSRKASLGCMFVCMVGRNSDGHKHIREAMLRGAVAIVIQENAIADIPNICPYVNIIRCESTRSAAAKLYSVWYGEPAKKLRIVAVTGTNGKTSVSYMLRSIFEAAMYRCGIIGTVMCGSGERQIHVSPDDPLANMTTPDPKQLHQLLAFMVADKVEYVFMEVSSHALKLCKTDGIEFDSAVFTNLSSEHLDFHGDMEDYAFSKAKLFSSARRSFINIDDKCSEIMKSAASGKIYTFSPSGEPSADFYAERIVNKGVDGVGYILRSKNKTVRISSRIPGGFTVDNTLAAASVALESGISPTTVHEAIASLCGVEGRMERVPTGCESAFSVFVDYAHTPDALENLLRTVRGFGKKNRIVLVFGCGGDRDKSKRAVMGGIASRLADRVIITADNSRGEKTSDIITDIIGGIADMSKCLVIEDRREAIDYVIKNASIGDVIILSGKGHEKYEIDENGRHVFDEKAIVAETYNKYHSGN